MTSTAVAASNTNATPPRTAAGTKASQSETGRNASPIRSIVTAVPATRHTVSRPKRPVMAPAQPPVGPATGARESPREHVSHATRCLDTARRRGVVLDLAEEPADMDVYRTCIG